MGTILVLGSSGSYGSVVCRELTDRGHRVIKAVHSSPPDQDDYIYRIDCSDPASMTSLQSTLFSQSIRLDAFINLAVCRGYESDWEFSTIHHLRINVVNPAYFAKRLCEFKQFNENAVALFPEDNTETYKYVPYSSSKRALPSLVQGILEKYLEDNTLTLLKTDLPKFSKEAGIQLATLIDSKVNDD